MDRARRAAALLLALCASPSAASQPAQQGYDRSVDGEKIAILCDPRSFRLSFRYRADTASLDPHYSRRMVIDPEALVAVFPNFGGEPQYRGALVRHERCGPLVIRLEGDFLNANVQGEQGAIGPFVAVRVWADNRTLYPRTERGSTRLAACDSGLSRWRECPADYAVRIDMAYRPETDTMTIREWASSSDGLAEPMTETERRAEVRAWLALWWSRRH